MKKIVLLAFLCLATSDVFAAVGCAGYDSMADCNSALDAYTCYWGFLRSSAAGQPSDKCYECTNLPLADNILVSSNTEVQPTISWLTSKTETGDGRAFNNIDGFCPILVSCPAGYGLRLYKNLNCNSNVINSDCRSQISCERCLMGTFGRETRLVRLAPADTSNDVGLYYVHGERAGYDGGDSTFVLDTNMIDGKMYGCGTCGTNAHINTAETNCDCDDGYGYYDPFGRVSTTNVKESSCVPRTYKIYLNTGSTASTSSPYIKYLPGTGYDLDKDGVYGDDGTNLDSVVNITVPKQNFEGWYFCPTIEGAGTVCGLPMWSTNSFSNSDNIVTSCGGIMQCKIDEYDALNLFRQYSWKNYTVKYADGTERTLICTYNSKCEIDDVKGDFVPDGKLFKNWVYSGSSLNPGEDFRSIEQLQANEFPNNQATLTPSYTECPAGYYCKNGEQTECDAGTYCPAGSSAPSQCPAGFYCEAGVTELTPCGAGYYCPTGSSAPTKCPTGTTSAAGSTNVAGATAITDCYINNQTKFVDGAGNAFYLPINDTAKIYIKQ